MADLKRCDRCGAEGPAHDCQEVLIERRLYGKEEGSLEIATYPTANSARLVHRQPHLDLCPNCRADLADFLRNVRVAPRHG